MSHQPCQRFGKCCLCLHDDELETLDLHEPRKSHSSQGIASLGHTQTDGSVTPHPKLLITLFIFGAAKLSPFSSGCFPCSDRENSGFMEVSSEEVAAHMLANHLVLTEDFAWKSGGSAGIYQKCPPCLLVRFQKIKREKCFPDSLWNMMFPGCQS